MSGTRMTHPKHGKLTAYGADVEWNQKNGWTIEVDAPVVVAPVVVAPVVVEQEEVEAPRPRGRPPKGR